MFTVTRPEYNPILSPNSDHPFEAAAAFNPCPILKDNKIHLVYRAMSEHDILNSNHSSTSVIAHAVSTDDAAPGTRFGNHRVLIAPDQPFDAHGCEDPRITELDGTYYIFYTALGGWPYSADNIRVAVAITDDLSTIKSKHLVTPFNAKAMVLFPSKVNGKLAALLTINTDRKPSDICYAEFDSPEDLWSPTYWAAWQKDLDSHKLKIRRRDTDHLEMGSVPVWTEAGWIVVYAHIQRYGQADQVFGFEALLLDLEDPRRIIGRTKGPFLVPETYYEEVGQVAHTIFPTGALKRDGRLEIYYGATDTHGAVATIPMENLLDSLLDEKSQGIMKRYPGNPIISPRPGVLWENHGTINPAAIDLDGQVHLFYRAVADGNVSTLGYAATSDGLLIERRSDKPVYYPRATFERASDGSGKNYGCEDPRLMRIGERIYMSYTGYNGQTPRVAITSIAISDFLAEKWSAWSMPEAITPDNISDKDAAILPEMVNNNYLVFHRVGDCVCADYVASLDFSKERITQCIEILTPRRGMWDGDRVGIAAPPIRTKAGWLLFYHGISWSKIYRVGAALLDLNDPTIVLSRTAAPIFEPQEKYEAQGIVSNVVFPCGLVLRGDVLYMYYGGADFVTGVATMKLSDLLRVLEN